MSEFKINYAGLFICVKPETIPGLCRDPGGRWFFPTLQFIYFFQPPIPINAIRDNMRGQTTTTINSGLEHLGMRFNSQLERPVKSSNWNIGTAQSHESTIMSTLCDVNSNLFFCTIVATWLISSSSDITSVVINYLYLWFAVVKFIWSLNIILVNPVHVVVLRIRIPAAHSLCWIIPLEWGRTTDSGFCK